MTLAACPDGPGLEAADDDDALRVANASLNGPEPVVAVDDDGGLRFLRRDVSGRFVAVQRRPPVAEALDLLPHPEGGWFRETWRTSEGFEPAGYGAVRQSATGIYFLLQPGEESVWHAVRSDEVWFWHRGGPLTLVLGGDGDRPAAGREITLGPAVERGQVPQALVPAGTWQAARPAGAEQVLVSCVVSPGFDFADFTAL
ncbi:cupin domain-containing protein [Sphaerisporangium sp. NPDC005288]|uniref:cupin domain-containing protein n=1 Tax=Sphaerisporangium sp. NPDC005288 TaxID=3155114 RepID=UPI0033A7BC4C